MTINDPVLSPLATTVHRNERLLDQLTRDGKAHALFLAYMEIHRAAEEAMERLNKISK